ncbi:putative RNA-directed DNA polymerase [Helianthus debilis subsp. tardiflorus]
MVNIYAPHDNNLKKELWEDLSNLMKSYTGSWIFLGDFNCVREPKERKNSKFNPQAAESFNHFIRTEGLSEYNMLGCIYTHRSDDGKRLSKIDRILVCRTFLSNWSSASLTALPRYRSDHRPLLLKCTADNFGTPPFRFFNSWLNEDSLHEIVQNSYLKYQHPNPPDKMLSSRLKEVKSAIKPWCRKLRLRDREIICDLAKKIDSLDMKAETTVLSEEEVQSREIWVNKMVELEENNLEDLKQRAKVKWLTEGDENSSFFHGIIKSHKKRNRINGLVFNETWISQPESLKEEVKNYFEALFKEENHHRPTFINNGFKVLSLDQSALLVKRFSKEEIKEAVWACGGDKAPGPDGFTFSFIRHFWEIMEEDFVKALDHFYVHGELSRGCNSSFITLIPKVLKMLKCLACCEIEARKESRNKDNLLLFEI